MKNLQISLDDFVLLQKMAEDFIVVDVREPWEVETAPFKEALNIPLSTLSNQLSQIPETSLIITLCHHGIRSLKAAQILDLNQKKALSLKGGIEDYSLFVDPTIQRY